MTGLVLSAFSMLGGMVAMATTQARTVIDVTQFGARPNSGIDATVPFQKAVAAVKAVGGKSTLRIPAGRYDFFSAHATRRACYYSNATEPGSDGMRTIALDLSGVRDLTVEGKGACLAMRGKMTMLVAEHVSNLTLRGLEFDFARPTVSEIRAVEKGDGYWVGEVHPDSTYRLVGSRIEWFGEDWHGFHNLVQHYDPKTSTVWRGGDPTASATRVEQVAGRRVRLSVPNDSLKEVVVGRTYQFRDTYRGETGMWFNRSRNVKMQDVKVRAMAGFGMLFQFTENIEITNLLVAPTVESGRTCVAAADILHFSGCRGQVRVRDSVLSAAHDDAMNVHGTHLQVVGLPAADQIQVRFIHPQTWGFVAFAPGDEIEFVKRDTLLPYAKAKVKAVSMSADPHEQVVTLDRNVPEKIELASDVVENVTLTPSVEISGCEISKVPTRGILLTTRRPVRIVGNRFFRTPMPSILLEDDAAGWFESGPVHDLQIRENTFFECRDVPIKINPENTLNAGPVHRNIRVENNSFYLLSRLALEAKSVAGLWFVGNRIHLKNGVPSEDLVKSTQSTGIVVKKNLIEP